MFILLDLSIRDQLGNFPSVPPDPWKKAFDYTCITNN